MPDRGHHCPFLNRADDRCARHFSLDDLGYALQHCFGAYETCAAYRELLVERRAMRARAHAAEGIAHGGTYAEIGNGGERAVQITVAGRVPHGVADPAVVSHAPGL
jgi:hypothetical protein